MVRKANDRGRTELDWLRSRHTFSFGEYFDPAYLGFRTLRVINDDTVQPSHGFGTHPHRDMEILTYVITGRLKHQDSMGHGRVIEAGELQGMSAGRGITHSEFNASDSEPVHFLQIWVMPESRDLAPAYTEWKPTGDAAGALTLLASPDGAERSVLVRQDVRLYLGNLATGQGLRHPLAEGRGAWVHVIEGRLQVRDLTLEPGDGLGLDGVASLELASATSSRFLLFDLR
jgi:quercetin 2,3-dioxygenase